MSISISSQDLDPEIKLTITAQQKILELMEVEENPELKLRVYIVGGGCSGYEYGFAFDQKPAKEDDLLITHITNHNTKIIIVIDAMSMTLLTGSTVDYIQDLHGSKFVIINPNAVTTCGCGSSFSI